MNSDLENNQKEWKFYTEERSKLKKLVITGIVIAIALIVVVFFSMSKEELTGDEVKGIPEEQVVLSSEKITENKAHILERLEFVKSEPLSPEEKLKFFDMMGGSKAPQYGFTNEEKVKILEALNAR